MAELSDDDLLKIAGQAGGASVASAPAGGMSDEDLLKLAFGGPQKPGFGIAEGMAQQALKGGSMHISENFVSPETRARNTRFESEHPIASTIGQGIGFALPMMTPIGWAGRIATALPRLAKAAEYVLPYANFNKAIAPGARLRTIANETGKGMLKVGAVSRAADPVDDQYMTGNKAKDALNNAYLRGDRAYDLKGMAMDYGLGAGGGVVGNKVGGLIGGTVQKLVDQVPRFSFNRGTGTGNGFYDWTRGGAQRAHDAISGDLRPGQSIEEAATHNMFGEFGIGSRGNPATHAYKYELARRYTAAVDGGLTPAAARTQVAREILADPALLRQHRLMGRAGGAPAISTLEDHVAKVARGLEESQQFPTTMQERIALSRGGETGKGAPTYGAAPNSFAAVDEMLTSPGSKNPGSARAAATNWVGQRQQTQNDRISHFLDEKLGVGDVHRALADHTARIEAAHGFYDPAIAAWQADPKAPQAMENAVAKAIYNWRSQNDFGKSVTQDTNRHIQNFFERKVQPAPIESEVATQNISQHTGQPINNIVSTPQLPEIRVPNQLETAIAQRSNFTREAEKVKLSDPSLYRAMNEFKKEHLDPAIRPLAPEWAAANDLTATGHAVRRAFSAGESFPLGASTRQAVELAKYRKLQQDPVKNRDHIAGFKAGFNANLQKRLKAKTSTSDQAVLFSKPEVGDAMRAIMGDADGNAALHQLQAVAAATKTNKIFAQSATHGREAEERSTNAIIKLVQSVGNAAAHPLRGLGEIAKWGAEKMSTEAARERNDRALRILTANTDDLPNYFRQIRDVTDSRRNHMPAVTQNLDRTLRTIGTLGGVASTRRRDE